MSLVPMYDRIIRATSLDPIGRDSVSNRYVRSLSVLPESVRCDDNPIVGHALITAKALIEEQLPRVTSFDFKENYGTNVTLARLRNTLGGSTNYWLDRYGKDLQSPTISVYLNRRAWEYPIYSTRRGLDNYWSYYPYSPSSSSCSSRILSLSKLIINERDIPSSVSSYYTASSPTTRLTWRDWYWSYPYKSLNFYRPAYVHSPHVRRILLNRQLGY